MSLLRIGSEHIEETKAFEKLREYEGQIAGLETTKSNHQDAIRECDKQITAIRNLVEPYRVALVRRLGGAK